MKLRWATDLERLAAAIKDPTRRRILQALFADRATRTVDEIAELAGVHRTVAFTHLELLTDLGLASKSRRRGRLGKPAGLYQASGRGLQIAIPPRQFAQLAQLLAEGLLTLDSAGATAARSAGRRFGESVAAGGEPRSVREALAPLEALGAAYEVEGDRVVARNCIFLEACTAAPPVVCGLHAGILEGLLQCGGPAKSAEPEGAMVGGGCSFRLVDAVSRPAEDQAGG